jgi:glycosyltransferase involved in cell wall biosynthesis
MDVSVVIPTRNRSPQVHDLLESLRALQAKGLAWEILVVDNASTDDTSSVVDAMKAGFPARLRYICEPHPGLHNGRNRGAQEAEGKVVAFLDDDMIVDRGWLEGARPVLERQAAMVGGRILPEWESSPPSWLMDLFVKYKGGKLLDFLGLIDLGDTFKSIDAFHVFGGNCFVLRDVVLRLKGYHPDSLPSELIKYRGDGETGFAIKFIEHKLTCLYSPAALTRHRIGAGRLTEDYFYRRAYNQGISDSFTRIRREHYMYAGPGSASRGIGARLAGTARVVFNKVGRRLSPGSRETEHIRKLGMESYREGFAFHQEEVKKDPKLLEWVLRPDYLGKNGELPA